MKVEMENSQTCDEGLEVEVERGRGRGAEGPEV